VADILIFECDRLENFLITRDRPVGNKVTNTISYAKVKVKYHMFKYGCIIAFDAQTEGKAPVTPKSCDCHTIM